MMDKVKELSNLKYIVTWWVKAGIVEQEEAAIARQKGSKHIFFRNK